MNLENLNVQELDTEEMKNVDGGLSAEYENDGYTSMEEWWYAKRGWGPLD